MYKSCLVSSKQRNIAAVAAVATQIFAFIVGKTLGLSR